MRAGKTLTTGLAIGALLLIGAQGMHTHPVQLQVPAGWPPLASNLGDAPITQEGVALGRRLFHDPVLSADSTISCSSCHLSYTAFSHVDHRLSHGIHDSLGTRNAPALMNLAWNQYFMWDGAVNHLEVQPLAPLSNRGEMGENIGHVVEKLKHSAFYPGLFEAAFGDPAITGERVLKALAQFQLTIISCRSRYDRVMAREPGEAFTEQETNGLRIFRAHCAVCHREPLFTTGEFANNGLEEDSVLRDIGRMRVTQNPNDSLCFKIPTLRNVEYSYPYMHDGRFSTLREVIAHYADGIVPSATLATALKKPIALSPNERTDLLAFLLTLSDRDALMDTAYAAPRP